MRSHVGKKAAAAGYGVDIESQYHHHCGGLDITNLCATLIMDQPPPETSSPTPVPHEPRVYESTELLEGAREILIRHAGELYRLRLTRNDKLILQK